MIHVPVDWAIKPQHKHKQKVASDLDQYGLPRHVCPNTLTRGIVKEEYLVIIIGKLSPVPRRNICCGYSLEVPH